MDIEHFRVVNGNDVIPHVPPALHLDAMSFRHTTVEAWFPHVPPHKGEQPKFSVEAESDKSTSSNSLDPDYSVDAHLLYLGYHEDHCGKVSCICPNGVPSRGSCGGSAGNYETKCVRCFEPYVLVNGNCNTRRTEL